MKFILLYVFTFVDSLVLAFYVANDIVLMLTSWIQNVNWTYIGHSEDVLDVYCTFSLSPVSRENMTLSLHKKWSFPLRISPVNVTKSGIFREFGDIYWRNSSVLLQFLCSVKWRYNVISTAYLCWIYNLCPSGF